MRLKGVITLKKRSEFVRVAKQGQFIKSRTLCAQVVASGSSGVDGSKPAKIRVGFTVSKKAGNAVKRNKIKRRFRDIAKSIIACQCDPALEYVLIGNRFSYNSSFKRLKHDASNCLKPFYINN